MKMSKTAAELPLAVAASQITNPTMQGYLDKKRPSKKLLSIKFQKRWCLVYGNYFFYYNSPDDKVQNGSFSLEGYRFLCSPGNGQYGFSLINQHKRPFEFMAANREEYIKWEKAIKKGIALTQRHIEPIRVKTEHRRATDDTKQTVTYKKSATLPNLNTNKRQQFETGTFRTNLDYVDGTQESYVTSSVEKQNEVTLNVPSSIRTQNRDNEKQVNTYNSDDDDDDNGYIQAAKLNLPKIDRIVETSIIPERHSYTEDDYMMVLSASETSTAVQDSDDPPYVQINSEDNDTEQGIEKLYSSVKRPNANITFGANNEIDPYASTAEFANQIQSNIRTQSDGPNSKQNQNDENHENMENSDDDDNGYIQTAKLNIPKINRVVETTTIEERQSYTEDDYMTVLSAVESSRDDPPYVQVNSEDDETKQGIEKLYSSIKRPGATGQCLHGTGYVSVDNFHDINSSGSEDDSDDDYVEPHEVISYSKVAKRTSIHRLSDDYERVPTFSHVKQINDTSSSSDSETDEDDYEVPEDILQTIRNVKRADDTSQHHHTIQNNNSKVSPSVGTVSSLTVSRQEEPLYENLPKF